jgi:hypothetical protein
VLRFAEVVDKRYPVKGMPVLRPAGFFMHNKIMTLLEHEWEKQVCRTCVWCVRGDRFSVRLFSFALFSSLSCLACLVCSRLSPLFLSHSLTSTTH